MSETLIWKNISESAHVAGNTTYKEAIFFLQGYYMLAIFEVYETLKMKLMGPVVIRLSGGDRKKIEQRTRQQRNEIVEPKDEDLRWLQEMIGELQEKITGYFRMATITMKSLRLKRLSE